MCGIAGFMTSGPLENGAAAVMEAMTSAIAHRGPDDSGQWLDPDNGVALGHRRLAILDLSPAGHQPMVSASGRFVLVYNGEIYNHHALRAELEHQGMAPRWRGHSDTEVLLACIDSWGVRRALEKSNGMFAFAVWDRQKGILTLARDRAGEKPLYYGNQGGVIVFASELNAIIQHPAFEGKINRDAVSAFMRFGYVPGPQSIWKNIRKLAPACFVEISKFDNTAQHHDVYWDLEKISSSYAKKCLPDDEYLVQKLEELIEDSVKIRMESDVPIGSFLSGGIDSSTITAIMQSQSSKPVKTFSVGFAESGYDESRYASEVAKHIGTDHQEIILSSTQTLKMLPDILNVWDEPFADSSQIPTYLVNSMAREVVTVALSGDGGDELFAGYNRHVLGPRIWQHAKRWPTPVRRATAAFLEKPVASKVVHGMLSMTGRSAQVAGLGERLPKIAMIVAASGPGDFYERLISQWPENNNPALLSTKTDGKISIPDFDDYRNTMLYLDAMTYLPDDILTKVDRAGMAVSLEARIPFLDHRIIEFSWLVPISSKIKYGVGKNILREILYKYVPKSLVDRPKAGFAVPVGDWLLGPLREWAETLLDPATIRSQGFLDASLVEATWLRFQSGEKSLLPRLWCVLMFQAWFQRHAHVVRQ